MHLSNVDFSFLLYGFCTSVLKQKDKKYSKSIKSDLGNYSSATDTERGGGKEREEESRSIGRGLGFYEWRKNRHLSVFCIKPKQALFFAKNGGKLGLVF